MPTLLFLVALFALLTPPAAAGGVDRFRVTLENLTSGQPFSPPVAATHKNSVAIFEVGRSVSGEAELLAENGDHLPMVQLLLSFQHLVTEVVDFIVPLVPAGSSAGGFTDRAVVDIRADRGDRLSLASMLICTNDGLAGIDRLKIKRGGTTYRVLGFDAGSEENTELSVDLPDPCSVLGPVVLPGDPNGNENVAVDMIPHEPVARHPGIAYVGDLGSAHDWSGPVARLTVVRLGHHSNKKFATKLKGFAESPPADSDGEGQAKFELKRHNRLDAKLKAKDLRGVTAAHIHLGEPGLNGPIVATLYPSGGHHDDRGHGHGHPPRDLEVEITLDEDDLDGGPFADDFSGFVSALRDGALYVNVHTAAYPNGEIRGQIGTFD